MDFRKHGPPYATMKGNTTIAELGRNYMPLRILHFEFPTLPGPQTSFSFFRIYQPFRVRRGWKLRIQNAQSEIRINALLWNNEERLGSFSIPPRCRPASGSVTSDRPPRPTWSGWPAPARRGGRSCRCTRPGPEIHPTRRFPPLPATSSSSAPNCWPRTASSPMRRWPRCRTSPPSGSSTTRSNLSR